MLKLSFLIMLVMSLITLPLSAEQPGSLDKDMGSSKISDMKDVDTKDVDIKKVDMKNDLSTRSDVSPEAPEFNPEVSSSNDCACATADTSSSRWFWWVGVLVVGGILFRKKL